MESKFFNNQNGNTLFEKFKGISEGMGLNFHTFLVVSGFFRSSGYFKLRAELSNVQSIKILVGIDIDPVFRKRDKSKLFFGDDKEAIKQFDNAFIDDVKSAGYSDEIEKGIIQLCDDLKTGKVEMRLDSSRNLHAKFYLCLPENHTPNSDGWVIMGSSNISESGLGTNSTPRYELNVAMKDYEDVAYCKTEFERLWGNGTLIPSAILEEAKSKTYLGVDPSPFEIYMKVLIDVFGEQAEDDFDMALPIGYTDLKYQRDAVTQGYQMLCKHNGFLLADVVGLGKTVVAAMIAKRFLEANGKRTNILVVFPPAVESNWKDTFKDFGLTKRTQFVRNGSIFKVLDLDNNYKAKEEFDLVIVDESHNFRRDNNERYNELQKICKSPRSNPGFVGGKRKKVILISATALNNYPSDLLNQILLFEDIRNSTIENVPNLQSFFAPLIKKFKKIMRDRKNGELPDNNGIDEIYEKIRREVLEKITVRRTRRNILNDSEYRKDLDLQRITFPEVAPPSILRYQMDDDLNSLFWETLEVLTQRINYARYRAIEFLVPPFSLRYENAAQTANILKDVYKVHMVKRLESSFFAFKKSLNTFIRITNDMIGMFARDSVLIIPSLDVSSLLAQGLEIDQVIEQAMEKGQKKEDICFNKSAFRPEFFELLEADRKELELLSEKWQTVGFDPKLEMFIDQLQNKLFDKNLNQTGKLVVFSESVDTVNYLGEQIRKRLHRDDVITVCSKSRNMLKQTIKECFDANYNKRSDKYNIIVTSDVLAEGINLHRSNVVVNYDTPWNASRLMQRIGRVNRIGSTANKIYNFLFYPSDEGDKAIELYRNSLLKMQGFQSALGEDAKIYSPEEIVKEFELYDVNVKDDVDKKLELLRQVKDFYKKDKDWYEKIKLLPPKSRVFRFGSSSFSVVFISTSRKTSYYKVKNEKAVAIDFIEAANLLKASKEEKGLVFDSTSKKEHFDDVSLAMNDFLSKTTDYSRNSNEVLPQMTDKTVGMALKFLRNCKRWVESDNLASDVGLQSDSLIASINKGEYSGLQREVYKFAKEYKNVISPLSDDQKNEITQRISDLYEEYVFIPVDSRDDDSETDPMIVVSESFVFQE